MPSDLFPDDLDFGQTIQIPRFWKGQKVFRRYTLKDKVGQGGMGIVWLAWDEDLQIDVALKVLPETLCHDHASLKALKDETKLGLRLAHPNIVRIYDFQRDDNAAAISMEYVDGATFSEIRTTKPTNVFDPADLHIYIEALCDALNYAHTRAGIVHRDIKPRNLMLNSQGELKIADFGISRSISESMFTVTGKLASSGSPPYISPQQWDGKPPTPVDDIYSVGATLYELLSSKPPFIGVVDWQQVHHKVPPSISKRRAEFGIRGAAPIPREWEETIAACLAKNPKDRPQTVRDLQARLTIAKTVDSPEEDFFDDRTEKDLPADTVDTTTARVEPKRDAPTAPAEASGAPASEPILNKRDEAIQDEEPKRDVPTAPVEGSGAPASEPILNKRDKAIQDEEPKRDVPTAPVEGSGAPASEPILNKRDKAIQDEEPKRDVPTAPVEGSGAPASEPILNKRDEAVQGEVTPQHVATAREEPKLDVPTAPVEGSGAPASEPILKEPAPRLEPPVRPTDPLDVLPQEKAAPTNGDVGFPPTVIKTPDRPPVIIPRPGKVLRWVWIAAVATILILGAIFIWGKLFPPRADLLIESEPSGADLKLDGNPPIKTPHTFKDLKFGPHRLTMTHDGYSPVERDIEFSGASLPKIVLDPIKPPEQIANLSVRSDPPGASIRLDGTLPQEPNTFRNVKFGEHRLAATKEGCQPKEQLLVVSRDTSSEIIVKLDCVKPTPPPDPLQPLLDQLKKAEAASDWAKYHMASLQLLGRLTSPGEPASNKHREKLTDVIEGFRKKAAALTSEEFRAYEENLKYAARLDIVPAILIVADKLRETNSPEAFNWYYYAAEEKHNARAMTAIAQIYWGGGCGQQVDKGRSCEWSQRGSQAGDVDARLMVGVCYLNGEGTPKNEDEGIRILEDLAKLGDPHAKTLIGKCYFNGLGHFAKLSESERYQKAKSFFEQAVLAGDWSADGELGMVYEFGLGVEKDLKQAAGLYLQGAEHESPICMYYYAQALEKHGPEIREMLERPQDKAETYYVKAAKRNVRGAREWCIKHKVQWEN